MFGHGCPLVESEPWVGAGVVLDEPGVVLVEAAVELVELAVVSAADVALVLLVAGAAEALSMPAAAPPVASAPATMVAPSIFEIFM